MKNQKVNVSFVFWRIFLYNQVPHQMQISLSLSCTTSNSLNLSITKFHTKYKSLYYKFASHPSSLNLYITKFHTRCLSLSCTTSTKFKTLYNQIPHQIQDTGLYGRCKVPRESNNKENRLEPGENEKQVRIPTQDAQDLEEITSVVFLPLHCYH